MTGRARDAAAVPVAVEPCADYGAAADAVDRVMRHLGGMDAFVGPGRTALLKPNLLSDAVPDRAATTHPDMVRAVIRAVRRTGADCIVSDSPASVLKRERVYQVTGMRAVCEAEGVPCVAMERDGGVLKRDGRVTVEVARLALEADIVINLPKLKTHSLTGLTCAVKNCYGCVPGMHKLRLHKLHFNARDFGGVVAAVYRAVRPRLSIVDAVVGMEGNGPSAGRPRAFGFVAASTDAVALDTAMCEVLGLAAHRVPYLAALGVRRPLRRAQRAARGDAGASVDIRGTPLEAVQPGGVVLPNTWGARLVPSWLTRLAGRLAWCRPAFTDRCVRCGLCVETCPAGALSQPDGGVPVLDPAKCIECCCCHEICPHHAIEMQLGPILRLAQRRSRNLR